MSVIDTTDDNIKIEYTYRGSLIEFYSKRQNIKVVDTDEFGLALFLDGSLQSTEKDEYIYHETIVHGLLSRNPSAGRVLILGGSEGFLAREIMKWPNICAVDQVDWDEELVNYYRTKNSVYQDSRLKVYHKDALLFLKNNVEKYDAIFVDLIDPVPETMDFFKELLGLALSHLSNKGNIIANVGFISPIKRGCADDLAAWLKDKIDSRLAICLHVPSFMQAWCFLIGGYCEEDGVLPETRFFEKDTLASLSKWSKDYSEDIRTYKN
jgi:spermidine synthase